MVFSFLNFFSNFLCNLICCFVSHFIWSIFLLQCSFDYGAWCFRLWCLVVSTMVFCISLNSGAFTTDWMDLNFQLRCSFGFIFLILNRNFGCNCSIRIDFHYHHLVVRFGEFAALFVWIYISFSPFQWFAMLYHSSVKYWVLFVIDEKILLSVSLFYWFCS